MSPMSLETKTSITSPPTSTSRSFHHNADFLQEVNGVCATVACSLLKAISQKTAELGLAALVGEQAQALVAMTEGMRALVYSTRRISSCESLECSKVLTSLDPNKCYILPSAHFPLLSTFKDIDKQAAMNVINQVRFIRQRCEVVSLQG